MDDLDRNVQRAQAKLTTRLWITGRRQDGYHLLDAEMVSLDLHDTLIFSERASSEGPASEGHQISVSGPEAEGVPADPSNLVHKALVVAGCDSAAVHIDKHIPHGGGLGGGSSDAAATLRWAGVYDPQVATLVGADVPFCVLGGRARVTGIGEILEPLEFEQREYTLVIPPFGVSTVAVYKAFAASSPDPAALDPNRAVNHLEEAAIEVEPRLALWREKIFRHTGVRPVLAGSGSTWFVEGSFEKPLDPEMTGCRWIPTRTTRPFSRS